MRAAPEALFFQPVGKDVAVGALEQTADRGAQFEHVGATSRCSRFSSNIADSSPIVATT